MLLVGNELGRDQSTPGLLMEERSEGSVAQKGRLSAVCANAGCLRVQLMLYFTGWWDCSHGLH